jgi:predicted component of viral defense system (DUF524 family)
MRMALPPIGSPNRPVELLRIDTSLFTLYLQGKPSHPSVETLQLHRKDNDEWVNTHLYYSNISSKLKVNSMVIYSHQSQDLIPWNLGEYCPPLFFETQSYEIVIEKKSDIALSFHHDNLNIRQSVLPKGSRILSGMLNFQNEVGYTELVLRLNGETVFNLQLEIFPTKIDYRKDYQLILKDINEQIYNLSFDFLRRTYHLTGLKETKDQSSTEYFTIIQYIFHKLIKEVERMQGAPHNRLIVENRLRQAGRVKKAGKENITYLAKHSHLLVQDNNKGLIMYHDQKFTPTHLLETKRKVDYDTMENRFVRWVLIKVQLKLKSIKVLLMKRKREADPLLLNKLNRMNIDLQRLLKLDFLQVSEMRQLTISHVLQMASGYREVYRYYLMLMKGLSIQSDLYRLSMKDVAQLYEYWCFIKIHQLLRKKYVPVGQALIKLNHGGLFVSIEQKESARIEYRNPKNEETFTLYYNALPKNDRSKTIFQRPDNILTLKKNEASVEYKYIFDAKYRLDPAYEGTDYSRTYTKPGPQVEDINTMHRYRDAIVYESENFKEYERSIFGAYVLFPYSNEKEFREHHFYKSIGLVNVGAIPFLPNTTELMENFLDEIILDSPEKAYERSARPRGTKEYYSNKLVGKTVLIGSLSHVDQINDALQFGFYHTPLSNISDHQYLAQLEYVAIYQSIKKFGSELAGIYQYGKIKEWRVVPRSEIKEIPSRRGASSELYVKLLVEEWLSLDNPIIPAGHGVKSILFTTKYMFDRAQEVGELRLETEEDLNKWREMRRQGKVRVKWDKENVDLAGRLEHLEVER